MIKPKGVSCELPFRHFLVVPPTTGKTANSLLSDQLHDSFINTIVSHTVKPERWVVQAIVIGQDYLFSRIQIRGLAERRKVLSKLKYRLYSLILTTCSQLTTSAN